MPVKEQTPATVDVRLNPAATLRKHRRPKPRRVVSVSRTHKPAGMSLEDWQTTLRREFGRQQKFKLENLGSDPVFSVFRVINPTTRGMYRVTVRGARPGDSHCTCPDFAINTLGTCKHIEFTLAKLERKAGGKRALRAGFTAPYSEVYLHYDAQRRVKFRAGSECPPELHRLADQYFDTGRTLRADGYERLPEFLKAANDAGHELRCHDDVLVFIARLRDQANLRHRLEKQYPEGLTDSAARRLLKVPLYPYQREGAFFAAKAGRALIADDMGLGKTIQAIAAAELLARHGGAERVLIVCPTSLKHQWQQEVEKFIDRRAIVVEGPLHHRHRLFREEAGAFFKIVNYDVVHQDLDAIADWSPDLVILDEAQRIKNWKTRVAQSVKRLESPYALVLTGTPLENRIEELHSIVEFVDRFRLGPAFRFLHEHQQLNENGRVIGYRNLDRISRTLSPILVRRTKDQVLKELPQRLDKRLFVPMTEQQRRYHEENKEIVARIVQRWRRQKFLSDADQRRLMIALQNMRMSCNSTYLLDGQTDHGVKTDELIDQLADGLEEKDAKAVIFSQWVRTHELIQRRMDARKWGYVMFHGGVPGPQRKNLVHRFKQDARCRFFLSTDAGGVGLNLQNANVVVNMDQPWNPAVLEQRIGRVHRLGQLRPVRVLHLIAQGTIEEGMLGVLSFKKSMFTGVLDGGQSEVFLGGTKLQRFMESVDKVTGAIPAAMPTPAQASADEACAAESAPARVEAPSSQSPERASLPSAWADVAAAGLSLLDKLAAAVATPAGTSSSRNLLDGLITRDDKTGENYLRLPVPKPQALEQLATLLKTLIAPT